MFILNPSFFPAFLYILFSSSCQSPDLAAESDFLFWMRKPSPIDSKGLLGSHSLLASYNLGQNSRILESRILIFSLYQVVIPRIYIFTCSLEEFW